VSDLRGGVTVITGGAGGLGRALAREAGTRGSRVLIGDTADAGEVVQNLRDEGVTVDSFHVDVTDYSQVSRFAEYARSTFGEVNVVINCVVRGEGTRGPLEEADPEGVRSSFEVNITGYFNAIHAFTKDLRAAAAAGRPAYVLNVGSEHTFGPPPHGIQISAYTVTKSTMLAYTNVLRRDFAGSGIGVTMLAPSWILTPQVQRLIDESDEFAAAVAPYVQLPAFVAWAGFEGMLRNDYIVYTNPRAVGFAIQYTEAVLAELRRSDSIVAEATSPVWLQP
jgi:NAD(P)-dependent dehydrogenase (short-subunit alcohol dehydrogenase family)